MIRSGPLSSSLITLLALSSGAALFGQAPANSPNSGGLAAGPSGVAGVASVAGTARKEIYCSSMQTGQLCPDDTATILGLNGAQAEAWKAILGKYNKAADEAAAQLQKDSAAKLTPEQMAVLKAWFAVGWNAEINKMLHQRNLDDITKADTKGLSTKKEEGHDDH